MVPLGRRLLTFVALLAYVMVSSRSALAADAATRSAARDLGNEGVAAYQAGDYTKATELLETAYDTLEVPTLALWSARALEKNGKLVEAAERYYEATRLAHDEAREKEPQVAAQTEAKAAYEELKARIPKVLFRIEGAEPSAVEITINGERVPPSLYTAGRPTNPGPVEVIAIAAGRTVTAREMLAEGERKTVVLTFRDPTTAPAAEERATQSAPPAATAPADGGSTSNWQRPLGWSFVGVGAAGLVFGTVTGIMALDKYGQLNAACPDGECPPSQTDTNNSYNALRGMSATGLIAGAVLGAAGVTLLLVAPKEHHVAHVTPYIGLTGAGLRGAF